MAELYIADFDGGEQGQARREAERRRLSDRYACHLVAGAGVDEAAARRVITVLFDPRDADGNECPCSCHPQLSAAHGDGFDCRCTWDEDRHAAEAASWQAWWDSPEAAELSAAHQREEDAIAVRLAGQPGVDARRISFTRLSSGRELSTAAPSISGNAMARGGSSSTWSPLAGTPSA